MKSRLLAPLAVSAAILFATSGCALISPQATTIPYSASDGVNVTDSGPLLVRNALVVIDDGGVNGNLIAAVVNDTDSSHTLNVSYGNTSETIDVPADTVVSLGATDDPLFLAGVNTPAGADVEIAFQSGDGSSVLTNVPVLDGSLEYLEPLVPTEPSPSPTTTPTPPESATPAESE